MKIKALFSIFLVFVLAFAITACGGECAHADVDKDGKCDSCGADVGTVCTQHTDSDRNGKCDSCNADVELTPEYDGTLELVKDGVHSFQFVLDDNINNDNYYAVTDLADKISQRINGAKVDVLYDSDGGEETVEILIGTVKTRGEKYNIDKYSLGYDGYIVEVIDSKIVVLGGSDKALKNAITDLEKKVFGIKNKVTPIENLTVTENIDERVTEYSVESVTIDGKDLSSYVIATHNDTSGIMQVLSSNVQEIIYKGTGHYLQIVTLSALDEGTPAIVLEIIENGGDRTTAEGFNVYVSEDSCLRIECEFPDKFSKSASNFITSKLAYASKKNVSFSVGSVYTENVRDIYYSDFNAKGDGFNDDFNAIKAAHDYANLWGHTVHATAGKTYYIGIGYGNQSIHIRTDTYWHGATFIFDDSERLPSMSEWSTPRFVIDSDSSLITYKSTSLPITSLAAGAENIGFAPGFPAMVIVYDESESARKYFRYGTLADAGDEQHELLLVDAQGNIDPSTPVQWDYTVITKIEVVNIENDKPITFSGADGDEQAIVETVFFQSFTETYLGYSSGDFKIKRANVTFKNIYHKVSKELLPGETSHAGASYNGFTNTEYAYNVTFENLTLYRYNLASYNTNYRSYEIRVGLSNEITWRNCNMSNFFDVDGSVRTQGMMGTNYSRNLYFDNVEFNTFDAHRGSYNVTVENSTLVYLSIIGAGKLTVKNTTFYTTRMGTSLTHAIWLRDDYGSTFWGDMEIDNVELKYAEMRTVSSNGTVNYQGKFPEVSLISAVWAPYHDFGYECALPANIFINNVYVTRIDYGIDENGKRWETEMSKNEHQLYLFPSALLAYTSMDIYRDDKMFSAGQMKEIVNPYKPCDTITITNCSGVKWVLPATPQFKETVITIDGVEQ